MTKKYRWIFGILITICMSIILILISSIALDYHRNVWRYLGGPVSDGIVPQKVIGVAVDSDAGLDNMWLVAK